MMKATTFIVESPSASLTTSRSRAACAPKSGWGRASHPRRDPPPEGSHRGIPRQGHQGPLRQGHDGFSGRSQGDGGHRLQRLVHPGRDQDVAGGREERPLGRGLPEGNLRAQLILLRTATPDFDFFFSWSMIENADALNEELPMSRGAAGGSRS